MDQSESILDFWDWFQANVSQIEEAYRRGDSAWLNDAISPRIKQINDRLNWEIGPYHHPENTFILSPTIRENLPITRKAVANAPVLEGWRFLHAKPPKILESLIFSACGCTINADDWRYRLTSYNNGEFVDIEIFVNEPIVDEQLFCELVIEALVGEERRLERVGYLLPRIVDDNRAVGKTTPIQYLRRHLDQVLQ